MHDNGVENHYHRTVAVAIRLLVADPEVGNMYGFSFGIAGRWRRRVSA